LSFDVNISSPEKKIYSFVFRYDRATGYSYGYGFVDYYRAEDAAKGEF
jgi:hypothetical protein